MGKYYSIEVKHKKFTSLNDYILFEKFEIFFKYLKLFDSGQWIVKINLSKSISLENYVEYIKYKNNISEKIIIPEYINNIKILKKYLRDEYNV